jgi:hypothetical protein
MRRLHLWTPFALSLACAPDDGTLIDSQSSNASQPAETGASADDDATDAGSADDTGPDGSDGADGPDGSDASDASDDDPSDADASDSDPTGNDDATGGLPDGVLAQGELYPADIIRVGGDLYWANQSGADCIRRVSIDGGAAVDIACEATDDTMPLQVIGYDGKLAYSFMSTGGGPSMGFGGVRLVDLSGGAPQTIDEGSRFQSSSSGEFCNDTLTASGSHLFWFAHILSAYDSSIVHFDGGAVSAFAADSPFPYGVLATPTAIYWSATEAFERLALDALGSAPMTIGTTVGSTCGRTSGGESLYLSSRGTFGAGAALFRYENGLFSNVHALDETAYDLAVDGTHLYLAFGSRVDRLPLAGLEGGAFETLVENAVIGGILIDEGQLYWTDYEGGEVRVQPVP